MLVTSTLSSFDGSHPVSKPGHHDDRWMVTSSTYWRAFLALEKELGVVVAE
jgi:hypothetical protein